jgi:hypothetical protein
LGSIAGGAGAAGSFSTGGAVGFAATGSTTGSGASTFGATGFSTLRTASAGIAAGAGGLEAIAGGAASGALAFSITGAATGGLGATAAGLAGVAAGGGGAAFAIAGVSGAGFLIAFRTSPGFEILEKSNFGLGASARDAPRPSPPELLAPCFRNLRMRSASSSSTELEWVFFSVTPTFGKTSRISLLFTSSSLARSLIRTFDIRLPNQFLVSGF